MSDWNSTNQFLVKQQVGFFKAARSYDVFDLQSGEKVLECREPKLGFFTKLFRFHNDYKRMTPFNVEVRDTQGNLIVRAKRGVAWFASHVKVYDSAEKLIGGFKQKMFSFTNKFTVLDDTDKPVCDLKGNWIGWDFKFVAGDMEFAHITKKWAGIGKELFTSADNYVLNISPEVPPNSGVRRLIFAAVLCIDMVLKE